MATRWLEVTLISAKDLDDVNNFTKMDVYAVAEITADPSSRQRTATDKDGGTSPSWNATLRFAVPASADAAGSAALHILLRSDRALGDRDVGEVHIPLEELLHESPVKDSSSSSSAGDGGKNGKFVSCQVRKPKSGKAKGVLDLSYKLGDVIATPPAYPWAPQFGYPPHGHGMEMGSGDQATAYPPAAAAAYPPPAGGDPAAVKDKNVSDGPATAYPAYAAAYPPMAGSYPAPPHGGYQPYGQPPQGYPGGHGHGYGAPPPGYGYGYGYQPPMGYGYGAPPLAVAPPQAGKKKKSKMGGGLGAGLLGGAIGGLLLGDMMVDSAFDAGFEDGAGF